jgi:hypothetical protein
MKKKLLLATAMISGLMTVAPGTASADIRECVNYYFWAGEVDQSYRCGTEEFPECVNYYFWAGQVTSSYNCVVEVGHQ